MEKRKVSPITIGYPLLCNVFAYLTEVDLYNVRQVGSEFHHIVTRMKIIYDEDTFGDQKPFIRIFSNVTNCSFRYFRSEVRFDRYVFKIWRRSFQNMESLTICFAISDRICKFLFRYLTACPSLNYVSLRDCSQLTDYTFLEFVTRLNRGNEFLEFIELGRLEEQEYVEAVTCLFSNFQLMKPLHTVKFSNVKDYTRDYELWEDCMKKINCKEVVMEVDDYEEEFEREKERLEEFEDVKNREIRWCHILQALDENKNVYEITTNMGIIYHFIRKHEYFNFKKLTLPWAEDGDENRIIREIKSESVYREMKRAFRIGSKDMMDFTARKVRHTETLIGVNSPGDGILLEQQIDGIRKIRENNSESILMHISFFIISIMGTILAVIFIQTFHSERLIPT